MIKIEGTHFCYNCDQGFKWESTIRKSKNELDSFILHHQKGEIAFIKKDVVQVTVPCSKCTEDNIFEYQIND